MPVAHVSSVGVPDKYLDHFPALKAHCNRIMSLPALKARYAKHTEGVYAAFHPDAAPAVESAAQHHA